ncbi:MAG: bifunctional demethylmenaquinone methyltransferase/2-methoxy-6-polyprenyl-1,4-benzoquinol methylase UbiE [Muribaculaceae bacterium]|nr:bifunctional demethylmenaquinone methyltransferase/2-methoxy-6-polyprenyl-1,4-benzoquinol methylase UbiE [Muribaculaceae bacterium]
MKIEQIKPYNELGNKAEQVEQMFDSIAPAYDFMNRAMTLGIDRWWRKVAVKRLKAAQPQHVLDVATGTGDFAIKVLRHTGAAHVTGIDLSEGMLQVAREKVDKAGLADKITFSRGDCLALPFADNSFDAVTVAFGVRNFQDIERGYREMLRVLRPGGQLCVLELSTPQNRFIRFFYDIYAMHVIPFLGSLKSGDRSAYRYLPLSIAAVPQGSEMCRIMTRAGFTHATATGLTLGVCTLYIANKQQ